jgi:hypothetical protein
MRNTLSGPDTIPMDELGAVARRITFSMAQTPGLAARVPPPPPPPPALPSASASAHAEPIAVVLRVRPLSLSESADGPAAVTTDPDRPGLVRIVPRNPTLHNATIRANACAVFRFAHVFDEGTTQERLFAETTRPLVHSLFRGGSGLVFAYGTSNAGKTYTIQGTPDKPGILPRSLDVIFNSIAAAKNMPDVADDEVSDAVARLVNAQPNEDTFEIDNMSGQRADLELHSAAERVREK